MIDDNDLAGLPCADGNFIDGRSVAAATSKTLPVENPATGEIIARLAAGDAADIEDAVAAARAGCGIADVAEGSPVPAPGKMVSGADKLPGPDSLKAIELAAVKVARVSPLRTSSQEAI